MNKIQTALLAAILVVLVGIGFELHRFNDWLRGGMLVPRVASVSTPPDTETREQRNKRLQAEQREHIADARAILSTK